jgi:alginate O-acetyltransferase complex protein AlgI
MVFSDPVFILGFLPVTLLIFHLVRYFGSGTASILWLIGCSLFFYGYWSVPYMFLLLAQISINYFFALQIQKKSRPHILTIAVIFNLALLGYLKYRNFFLENFEAVFHMQLHLAALIVPLGISFHTFQQLALLVDVRDESAEVPPYMNYLFFVVFFPQLIAGPIVLHREMGKQVTQTRAGRGPGLSLFGAGLFLFAFGLFKKICLADAIATYSNLAFLPGQPLQTSEAWLGSIAYALQLYFDFSGYSDMAVGLGCMLGFKLPNNFLVPFAATSMIEYWKRWHITMTRFFTMYVYMPMALSAMRFSEARRLPNYAQFLLATAIPTFITFLLSGLWHGAGWTFIFFGIANGVGLLTNHAWLSAKMPKLPRGLGWALTAINVLVTLVFFRAKTLGQSFYILRQMFWPERTPLVIPSWVHTAVPHLKLPSTPFNVLNTPEVTLDFLWLLLILAPLSVLLPALSAKPEKIVPTWRNSFSAAAMAWFIAGMIGRPQSFLYFAF